MGLIRNLLSGNNFIGVIFVAIIAFLVMSNLTPILEKMGIQTRATVKTELAKAQEKIKILVQENEALEKVRAADKIACELKINILETMQNKNQWVDDIIDDIIKDVIINPPKIDTDPPKVNPNFEEYPKEIVFLNRAYNELYGS